MTLAFAAARAAGAQGEVPVGAVIVRDGVILAEAGNRTLLDKDPTAHAEMLAIRAACQAIGSERLIGCDLYVTLEPCAMCAAAISFARLRRLYWAASDPKGGAIEQGRGFLPSRPATIGRRPMAGCATAKRPRCCAGFLRRGGEARPRRAGKFRAFFAGPAAGTTCRRREPP